MCEIDIPTDTSKSLNSSIFSNKLSFIKRSLFKQSSNKQNNCKNDEKNKRESKVMSICSYDRIDFAPLAKPESLSDITQQFDEFVNNNSFRNSILKMHEEEGEAEGEEAMDEEDRNRIISSSNDPTAWWSYGDQTQSQIIEHQQIQKQMSLNDNSDLNLMKTSTPRNDGAPPKIENYSADNSGNNSSTNPRGGSEDINETSSFSLNSDMHLAYLSNNCSSQFDNQYNNSINNPGTASETKTDNLLFPSTTESSSKKESMIESNNSSQSMTTNFMSIEKLPIMKPQSKDYILCFDTSMDGSIPSNNNERSQQQFLRADTIQASDNGNQSANNNNNNSNNNNNNKLISQNEADFDSGMEISRTLSPDTNGANYQQQQQPQQQEK